MASSLTPFDATESAFGDIDAKTAAALFAVAGDIALVMDGAGVIRDVALIGTDTQFDAATGWIGRPWIDTVTTETRAKIDTLLKEAHSAGSEYPFSACCFNVSVRSKK